jgi:hypothetical protein
MFLQMFFVCRVRAIKFQAQLAFLAGFPVRTMLFPVFSAPLLQRFGFLFCGSFLRLFEECVQAHAHRSTSLSFVNYLKLVFRPLLAFLQSNDLQSHGGVGMPDTPTPPFDPHF